MLSDDFKMTSGLGFHLQPDGQWDVKNVPENVVRDSTFSGYLKIQGYKCLVYNTPEGDSWAQKEVGNSQVSSNSLVSKRIAQKYLSAKGKDIVTQVKENIEKDSMSEWNNSANKFFSKFHKSFVPKFNDAYNAAYKTYDSCLKRFPKADHPRVEEYEALKLKKVYDSYIEKVKAAKLELDNDLNEILKDVLETKTSSDKGNVMKPSQVATELRKIAAAIEASKTPDKTKVASAIKGLVKKIAHNDEYVSYANNLATKFLNDFEGAGYALEALSEAVVPLNMNYVRSEFSHLGDDVINEIESLYIRQQNVLVKASSELINIDGKIDGLLFSDPQL